VSPLRQTAERILASVRHMYAGKALYRRASEREFPHLDFSTYRRAGEALEARGFRHLADQQNLNAQGGAALAPTLVRSWVSADGTISAGHYQLRHLRWQRVYDTDDLVSELEGGGFVLTSTAELSSVWSVPEAFDLEFHTRDTPLPDLLRRHRERVAAAVARSPHVRAHAVATWDDLVALQVRLRAAHHAHRRRIGWLTLDELKALSADPARAEELFGEIQALLRAELSEPEPA